MVVQEYKTHSIYDQYSAIKVGKGYAEPIELIAFIEEVKIKANDPKYDDLIANIIVLYDGENGIVPNLLDSGRMSTSSIGSNSIVRRLSTLGRSSTPSSPTFPTSTSPTTTKRNGLKRLLTRLKEKYHCK